MESVDVEAGDVEAEASRPACVDKAVSTGDLGLTAPLGDLLAALVQSKASAIKAECERENERGRTNSRAWRLHWLHRKEPQARVTPVVHHHHNHRHHPQQHHHHHHHPHHHHRHQRQQQPPLTLHGSLLSPGDGSPSGAPGLVAAGSCPPGEAASHYLSHLSHCSSDMAACTLPAPQDATVTGMCTTSDAPGLPSDTTLSPQHPDDSDSDPGALPPLPLDPPPSRPQSRPCRRVVPLRRTLSSRSHQYHNYDYDTARVATSLSCHATPMATPGGTPGETPQGTPAVSAAPSRAASPPTPPDPENHLHLLYHSALPALPALPPELPDLADLPRPHRKKRRRRKAAGAGAAKRTGKGVTKKTGAKGAARKRGPLPPVLQAPQAHHLDPDDLPKRARWTIAITACFLLALSMLLVGITLRMAPIIDDMVRKQNEEHEHLLNRAMNGTLHHQHHHLAS